MKRETLPSCAAVAQSGKPCRAKPLHGSPYCFFHDPERSDEHLAASRTGGLRRSRPMLTLDPSTPAPELSTAQAVAALLGETIHHVRTGQVDPRVANAVGYLAGVLIRALEQGDLEERLERLEALVSAPDPARDLDLSFAEET